MTKIKDIIQHLEGWAPPYYQESYDNSGLLIGEREKEVTGILITLDVTEGVIDEAVRKHCNLIIAHHPIIFKGIKKLTGTNYVERTVVKAIRKDLAIYAIHTNLDNVSNGVNLKIAEKIGLKNLNILLPSTQNQSKLTTFVPEENTSDVLEALHNAGAGIIGNYSHCSFLLKGTGAFLPEEAANPHTGQKYTREEVSENRIEVIFPSFKKNQILAALQNAHPYEEVAYYLHDLANINTQVGAGMIGDLSSPLDSAAFLSHLKRVMALKIIKHTKPLPNPISRVALCGGAGSFLLKAAICSKR